MNKKAPGEQQGRTTISTLKSSRREHRNIPHAYTVRATTSASSVNKRKKKQVDESVAKPSPLKTITFDRDSYIPQNVLALTENFWYLRDEAPEARVQVCGHAEAAEPPDLMGGPAEEQRMRPCVGEALEARSAARAGRPWAPLRRFQELPDTFRSAVGHALRFAVSAVLSAVVGPLLPALEASLVPELDASIASVVALLSVGTTLGSSVQGSWEVCCGVFLGVLVSHVAWRVFGTQPAVMVACIFCWVQFLTLLPVAPRVVKFGTAIGTSLMMKIANPGSTILEDSDFREGWWFFGFGCTGAVWAVAVTLLPAPVTSVRAAAHWAHRSAHLSTQAFAHLALCYNEREDEAVAVPGEAAHTSPRPRASSGKHETAPPSSSANGSGAVWRGRGEEGARVGHQGLQWDVTVLADLAVSDAVNSPRSGSDAREEAGEAEASGAPGLVAGAEPAGGMHRVPSRLAPHYRGAAEQLSNTSRMVSKLKQMASNKRQELHAARTAKVRLMLWSQGEREIAALGAALTAMQASLQFLRWEGHGSKSRSSTMLHGLLGTLQLMHSDLQGMSAALSHSDVHSPITQLLQAKLGGVMVRLVEECPALVAQLLQEATASSAGPAPEPAPQPEPRRAWSSPPDGPTMEGDAIGLGDQRAARQGSSQPEDVAASQVAAEMLDGLKSHFDQARKEVLYDPYHRRHGQHDGPRHQHDHGSLEPESTRGSKPDGWGRNVEAVVDANQQVLWFFFLSTIGFLGRVQQHGARGPPAAAAAPGASRWPALVPALPQRLVVDLDPLAVKAAFKVAVAVTVAAALAVLVFDYNADAPVHICFIVAGSAGPVRKSSLTQTLNRTVGIIFGTILPSLVLSWSRCSRLAVAALLLAWVFLAGYVYRESPEHGYAGLVGGFTTCQVALRGYSKCTQQAVEECATYGAGWTTVEQMFLAAAIVVFVELVLLRDDAPTLLRASLHRLFGEFSDSMETFFGLYITVDPTTMDPAIHAKEAGDLKRAVAQELPEALRAVQGHFAAALQEPALWRAPFPRATFQLLVATCQQLQENLELQVNAMSQLFDEYRACPSGFTRRGSDAEVMRNPLVICDETAFDLYLKLRKELKVSFKSMQDMFETNEMRESDLHSLDWPPKLVRSLDRCYADLVSTAVSTGKLAYPGNKVLTNHAMMVTWRTLARHFMTFATALRGCPSQYGK